MKDVLFWTRRFVMIYGIIMICTFSCAFFFQPNIRIACSVFFWKNYCLHFARYGNTHCLLFKRGINKKRMVVSYHTAFCDFRGSLSSIGTFGMESQMRLVMRRLFQQRNFSGI